MAEEVTEDDHTVTDHLVMDVVDTECEEASDPVITWQVRDTNMKRHMYKLTHQNIVPGRIGQVIPVTRMEVAPGDSFQGRIGILCRFKGFAAPVLTPTYLDFYMFYVPNRLAWAEDQSDVAGNWPDFITGTTVNADQVTGPVGEPEENITSTTQPPNYTHTDSFLSNLNQSPNHAQFENALYSRGYNLIYNNYFKDENDPDIAINNTTWQEAYQLRNLYNECRDDTAQWQTYAEVETNPAGLTGSYVGAESVRDAMRRQRFAERREMFGDRYVDLLRSYGVRTGYNMLERPESLGKSRHVVSFTDIPATSDSGGVTVGDLAGHGIVGLHHRMPRKTFNEHGYIHGVIVVRPSQFINTVSPPDAVKYSVDKWWAPEFESQTAQEVEEPCCTDAGSSTADPVGYIPKFQEYRKTNNFIQKSYKGSTTWGNEWTFEQSINSGDSSVIRDKLRKVTSTDYDNAFNSTSATEPHFRALVHNGITAYRLCGPQQKI
jgi:hypothetical protein